MAHGRSPRHVRKAKPAGEARLATTSPSGGKTSTGASSKRPVKRGAKASAKEAPEKLPRTLESAGEPVRLQRLLASAGFGSRREVESLIADGRVSVNGEVAGVGERATPGRDDIRLDGERVLSDRPVYWLVNKPRGVVTTVRDESGRRTVLDLLPRKVGRVFPVGRLDVETSGLLLLTNDGETAYAMLHPSLGNEREYRVSVKGALDEKAIGRLEKGVRLEEGKTAPGRVHDVQIDPKTGTSTFSLTLVEGRNRQIRRSLLILGFPVRRLVRERMGPLRLDGLAVGESRLLSPEERTRLLAHVASLRRAEREPGRKARGPAKVGMRGASARPRSAPATSKAQPGSARAGRPSGPAKPARPAGPRSGPRPAAQRARSRKGVRK
jgi:23S rRNA pseudouridine2605 synthase